MITFHQGVLKLLDHIREFTLYTDNNFIRSIQEVYIILTLTSAESLVSVSRARKDNYTIHLSDSFCGCKVGQAGPAGQVGSTPTEWTESQSR